MGCGLNLAEEQDLNIKGLLEWTKGLSGHFGRDHISAKKKRKTGLRRVTVSTWQSWC